ncbi:MAG: hypothetical protein CYPHOPRED_003897 [Cyphobasidiales sp. Tagirdzhanova-0007]|nr:MAG: hypothetical protein CYPHOPRED_003897 [Cyphobasidiales sp. Tagirdzhanova-0007]
MSSGAGMAIEDAAVLGIVLSRQEPFKRVDERRRFVGDRLELYQQARWARATEVQDRSTLNGRIWHYPDGPDQEARDAGMAASLGNEHYIRCTNQWSDPSTQVWLYGHDAEAEALRIVTKANRLRTDSSSKLPKGMDDMRLAGLLGP